MTIPYRTYRAMHDRTSSSLRLASLAVDTVTKPVGGFFGGAATHASMSAAQTI